MATPPRRNEARLTDDPTLDVWLSAAIVVRGAVPQIREFISEMKLRRDVRTVFIKTSGRRLRIIEEGGDPDDPGVGVRP